MFNILCQCGRQLKVPESAIGQSGKCPYCRAGVRLVAPHYEEGGAVFSERLVVASGPLHAGEQYLLGGPGPIEIGKLPDKPIILPGNKVSRSHCRLVRFNGRWLLEDQGSKNGTQVNGEPISRHRLVDGDAIQVGEFLLQFLTSAPPERPPPDAEEGEAQKQSAQTGSAAGTDVATAASGGRDETLSSNPVLIDDDDVLPVSEAEDAPAPVEEKHVRPSPADGPTCPGCQQRLPMGAKICVQCGINLSTGKAILTSSDENLDEIYATVESVIRVVSWVVPLMFYPMASEALGVRRPYVTWGIVAVTTLISMGVYIAQIKDRTRDQVFKQYMLWCGSLEKVTAEDIEAQYLYTCYGDEDAYRAKVSELEASIPEAKREFVSDDEIAHEALRRLPIKDRCYGRYTTEQLFTSAFLHGGIMHLAGNMIFLLVIGGRVNAMIGNLAMFILYPLLAAAAGLIFMASTAGSLPCPMIGASGAIMGLAGMYFILAPVNRVHMVIWLRPFSFILMFLIFSLLMGGTILLFVIALALVRFGFRLYMKMWAARGFWLLLFCISFDVLYTAFGVKSGVAHWAHMGGFLAGMAVGLTLLIARLVNARGGDLLSAMFGPRAWWLVGRPDAGRSSPIAVF